jgi:4-aminobutyrate aminotransferase-like enzyme
VNHEELGAESNRTSLLSPMHRIGQLPEFAVRCAEGVHLVLDDGRSILDAGSTSACLLGHGHPDLVRAIRDAAQSPYIDCTTGFDARPEAAEDLLRIAFRDEPWADTVAFFVSSSEACDLGLVLAQTLTEREPIVARQGKYHGASGLARGASPVHLASGHLGDSDRPEPRVQADLFRFLPRPSCERDSTGDEHSCSSLCLSTAPALLEGAAALLTENSPYGGYPVSGYHDLLAAIARKAGVTWMADETVTGFGRTGRWFSFQRQVRRPDFVQLGKGITGGAAPGGALVLSREIAEQMGERKWLTAGTYRGHPLTVAAVSTVVSVIERDGLIPQAAAKGLTLGSRLREISARHRSVTAVRGVGLMWAVELAGPAAVPHNPADADTGEEPLPDLVRRRSLELGVRFGIDLDGSLWLVPPLVIGENELELICEILDEALTWADRQCEVRGYESNRIAQ